MLKVRDVGEWGEREGGRGKEGREIIAVQTLARVSSWAARREGDVTSPVCLGSCCRDRHHGHAGYL